MNSLVCLEAFSLSRKGGGGIGVGLSIHASPSLPPPPPWMTKGSAYMSMNMTVKVLIDRTLQLTVPKSNLPLEVKSPLSFICTVFDPHQIFSKLKLFLQSQWFRPRQSWLYWVVLLVLPPYYFVDKCTYTCSFFCLFSLVIIHCKKS